VNLFLPVADQVAQGIAALPRSAAVKVDAALIKKHQDWILSDAACLSYLFRYRGVNLPAAEKRRARENPRGTVFFP